MLNTDINEDKPGEQMTPRGHPRLSSHLNITIVNNSTRNLKFGFFMVLKTSVSKCTFTAMCVTSLMSIVPLHCKLVDVLCDVHCATSLQTGRCVV